jgi:hypothetical protein
MIDLPNGPTKFRSTVVKLYYKDDNLEQQDKEQLPLEEAPAMEEAPTIEETLAMEEAPPTELLIALPPAPKVVILLYKLDNAEARPLCPQREHHLLSQY